MREIASIIFLFALTLAPLNVRAGGGGWRGGGGNGIMCFATPAAKAAALNEQGELKDVDNVKPELFYVTDIWQYSDKYEWYNLRALINESKIFQILHQKNNQYVKAHEYVMSAVHRWSYYNHPFYEKLEKILKDQNRMEWKPVEHLPYLFDDGFSKDAEISKKWDKYRDRCHKVQLVLRRYISDPGNSPQVEIDYDYHLIKKLIEMNHPAVAILNMAALMLHEGIYTYATELGQDNSINTRRITAAFLSENFMDAMLDQSQNYQRLFFRHFMKQNGFAYYFNFSNSEDRLKSRIPEGLKLIIDRLQSSWVSAEGKLYKRFGAELDRKLTRSTRWDSDSDFEQFLNSMIDPLSSELTKEETFMLAASFKPGVWITDTETLISYTKDIHMEMDQLCTNIKYPVMGFDPITLKRKRTVLGPSYSPNVQKLLIEQCDLISSEISIYRQSYR